MPELKRVRLTQFAFDAMMIPSIVFDSDNERLCLISAYLHPYSGNVLDFIVIGTEPSASLPVSFLLASLDSDRIGFVSSNMTLAFSSNELPLS